MKNQLATWCLAMTVLALSGCAHKPEPLGEVRYYLCSTVTLRPYVLPERTPYTTRVYINSGLHIADHAITVSGQKLPVFRDQPSYDWISVPQANGSDEGFYMYKRREASYIHESGRCYQTDKPTAK